MVKRPFIVCHVILDLPAKLALKSTVLDNDLGTERPSHSIPSHIAAHTSSSSNAQEHGAALFSHSNVRQEIRRGEVPSLAGWSG